MSVYHHHHRQDCWGLTVGSDFGVVGDLRGERWGEETVCCFVSFRLLERLSYWSLNGWLVGWPASSTSRGKKYHPSWEEPVGQLWWAAEMAFFYLPGVEFKPRNASGSTNFCQGLSFFSRFTSPQEAAGD